MLQDLLSEKLPRLMAHLGQQQVDLSLITFNWFLVVFADSLISDILLRVWDAFLYEGTKVSVAEAREPRAGDRGGLLLRAGCCKLKSCVCMQGGGQAASAHAF